MKFDYTRSMKIHTAKNTKSEDALRYMVQLFERDEQDENERKAELNRLRCRVARDNYEMEMAI